MSINSDIELILNMEDGNKGQRRRFTPSELRREIHSCEIKASVHRTFGEDDWFYFYEQLGNSMRQALKMLTDNTPVKTTPINGRLFDIESIKRRVDILNIAERYTALRKSGQTFIGKCPLHDSKGRPFTVYPEQQSWHCYHCDEGGDVIRLIMHLENCDFRTALGQLQ